MSTSIKWQRGDTYWIANARTPVCLLPSSGDWAADHEGVTDIDLCIEGGRLARIAPPGSAPADSVDLGGRQVWPTLVDIHTHLDKGHTIERAPNADGSFDSALFAAARDRPNWTEDDLLRRMTFALKCAYGHGVSAIRTHLDSHPDQAERTWKVLRQVRGDWAGRIDLQAVSLIPLHLLLDDFGERLAKLVAESNGVFGGVTRSALGGTAASIADLDPLLDRLFGLAARHDLDIDLHVDETGDRDGMTLPEVARAAIRHGYRGRVVCGHCCALAVQPEDEVARTLDLVAEAGIGIVTLPTVNMYLQDRRAARTPRWRGVTLIHEMRSRGIRVAVAGDNCRDSFHAYGDHDVIDTFRQSVRILHLDHPFSDSPALVGPVPADMGGFSGHGRLAAGDPARLIVFNARTLNHVMSRPQADRVVIDRGRRITMSPPDYAELWADQSASPDNIKQ